MCYLVDYWSVRQGLFRHFCSRERDVVMTSAAGVFFIFDEILIIIWIHLSIISRFYRYDQHLCLILFHFSQVAIYVILRSRGLRVVLSASLFVAFLVATQLSVKIVESKPFNWRRVWWLGCRLSDQNHIQNSGWSPDLLCDNCSDISYIKYCLILLSALPNFANMVSNC